MVPELAIRFIGTPLEWIFRDFVTTVTLHNNGAPYMMTDVALAAATSTTVPSLDPSPEAGRSKP